MAREPKTKPDNQELAQKSRPNPRIKKYEGNQDMSYGWIQQHTGAIFFKRISKNFKKRAVQLSQSHVKKTEEEIQDPAATYITPYWGKFFYLREARKIYSTPHTGTNFSIFEKLENFI
jgi:hypothetical protein